MRACKYANVRTPHSLLTWCAGEPPAHVSRSRTHQRTSVWSATLILVPSSHRFSLFPISSDRRDFPSRLLAIRNFYPSAFWLLERTDRRGNG
ncbi:hypothetical protein ACLOJK_011249 [Asimina triloba]